MILRISKCVVIAAVLWFARPWFSSRMPSLYGMEELHGRGAKELFWAAQAFMLYSKLVTLVLILMKICAIGEPFGYNAAVQKLQRSCTRLLLYSIMPILGIAVLVHTMTANYLGKITSIIVAGAALCLLAMPKRDKKSMYGLQHGKLHLDVCVPMWMNMGYWKVS